MKKCPRCGLLMGFTRSVEPGRKSIYDHFKGSITVVAKGSRKIWRCGGCRYVEVEGATRKKKESAKMGNNRKSPELTMLHAMRVADLMIKGHPMKEAVGAAYHSSVQSFATTIRHGRNDLRHPKRKTSKRAKIAKAFDMRLESNGFGLAKVADNTWAYLIDNGVEAIREKAYEYRRREKSGEKIVPVDPKNIDNEPERDTIGEAIPAPAPAPEPQQEPESTKTSSSQIVPVTVSRWSRTDHVDKPSGKTVLITASAQATENKHEKMWSRLKDILVGCAYIETSQETRSVSASFVQKQMSRIEKEEMGAT